MPRREFLSHKIIISFFPPRSVEKFAFSFWTASESLLLVVANQNQLIADNITKSMDHMRALIQDGSHIVAVDFDSVRGRIFWSDKTLGKIFSAFQNGTDRKPVSTFLLTFGLTRSPVFVYLLLLPS